MIRIAIRKYLQALGLISLFLPFGLPAHSRSRNYYGKYVGRLTEFAHGIRGEVFAVDDTTLFIKGFWYDGTGPDAFFWVGSTPRPSPEGVIVPYPEVSAGSEPKELKAFKNDDIILRLPVGKKIRDIKWLSVWCRRFTVNFGDVFIPQNQETPKTRMLPEFRRLAHGLRSGNITILDSKTFYIPNLHYDGAGPDAYFWVGNGSEPSPLGIKVPNEMGSLAPLRGYQGEDIEIQLPGNLTVYDIDWLAVWCVEYRHNFGHIFIPKDLDVPPALGQTKVSPPWWYEPPFTFNENPFSCWQTTSTTPEPFQDNHDYSNCQELLDERLQVYWDMLRNEEIKVQLSARIRDDQYMAFGLSGENGRSAMVGGDIVVAYYDPQERTFHAEDYYMSATSQCDGIAGVCPDERIGGRNDVILVSGLRQDGVTTITYRRPLQTNEPIKDRSIPSHGLVNVIAAIGPLNARKEANAHGIPDKTSDDVKIDFSSKNDNRCRTSLYTNVKEEEKVKAWPPQVIVGEKNFTIRIGPTGGKRGYTPITGHPSWGIAWWVNDKLIPELYLERGQTYTFIVEGGSDNTNPARFHPFYITDSSEGGYGQKNTADQKRQKVYAGVATDNEGYPYPTAVGRYCEYVHKTVDRSLQSETFDEYRKTLNLVCDHGEPYILTWTVPQDAPNLLYYQCYTHNNLGWKIHVVNPGFHAPQNAASVTYTQTFCLTAITVFCQLLLIR